MALQDPEKRRFRELFLMHQGERRGLLVLVLLAVLLFAWASYQQWWRPRSVQLDDTHQRTVAAWLAAQADTSTAAVADPTYFPFNPNTIERADWLQLGLTERQVDGIERFREKGGRFRSKDDLARMYSLRPEQVAALKPYVQLPDHAPQRAKGKADPWPRSNERGWQEREVRPTEVEGAAPNERQAQPRWERGVQRKVEVNTADSAMLVALPGVGPAFARGILKYRDKLGGFHRMEQLAEVYVLKDKPDALERLAELLVVDSLMVRQLPINTCTVEQLAAHPYAGWKVAKPLIAYRQHHGPFKQLSDIRACAAVDEAVFRKLAPYLAVE
jgi:DNA uptake protein ComE-like DNA-binding protein